MNTLSNRLARTSPRWRLPLRIRRSPAHALGRVLGVIDLIMETFAESQDMAREAAKRYPFMDG